MADERFQIFVSYRRQDAPAHAGRLYDRLAAWFGEENVFLDVDAIGPGRDFRKVIEERLDSCDVFIAVIGRGWLDVADEQGTRRLERENDYVRLETEAALRRGEDVTVIPALVAGATVPPPERLPNGLADLSYRNAAEIRDASFHADARRLIEALEVIQRDRADRRRARAEEQAARQREAEAAARAQQEEDARRQQAEAAARAAAEEARRQEAAEAAARAEEEAASRREAEAAALAAQEEARRREAAEAAAAEEKQKNERRTHAEAAGLGAAIPRVQTVKAPSAAPAPEEPADAGVGTAVPWRSIPLRWMLAALCGAAIVATIIVSVIVFSGGGSPQAGGGTANLPAATPIASASCNHLVYEGPGSPQLIVVSDLPLQGGTGTQGRQLAKAVEVALRNHSFKAGSFRVGFQSCDDSTTAKGSWDEGKCALNAHTYAGNASVIGVVGTLNSPCTQVELPVLNSADGGPVPMISPANVDVGLTRSGPGTQPGEPDKYYPTGRRSYARMVGADDVQGAAGALLVKRLAAGPVFVLDDGDYGRPAAHGFRTAAKSPGVDVAVAGSASWDPAKANYDKLVTKIRRSGARGVYLGGLIDSNGGRLLKDLRAGLGPSVAIVASDGFSPVSYVAEKAGAAAQGMYVTTAGAPTQKLPARGKRFAADLADDVGKDADPYAVFAGQAAEVLLAALAHSDGTRSSVVHELLPMKVTKGLVSPFMLDLNGDPSPAPFTVYRVKGGDAAVFTIVRPTTKLVTNT